MDYRNRKQIFSLRKFKGVGLASAVIASMFFAQGVSADVVVNPNGTTTISNDKASVVVKSNHYKESQDKTASELYTEGSYTPDKETTGTDTKQVELKTIVKYETENHTPIEADKEISSTETVSQTWKQSGVSGKEITGTDTKPIVNSDLEKKIKDLEKQNEEILKKQQEQQKIPVAAPTKKIQKQKVITPKILNYESKLENRVATYEASRDRVSEEYGWSVEETQANEQLNEKLDDELTKVYNLIMERLPEERKIKLRNEQRQWLKIRKRKVANSNQDENGESVMGGRAAGNVEIMTYQDFTKERLFEFARMYDNMD